MFHINLIFNNMEIENVIFESGNKMNAHVSKSGSRTGSPDTSPRSSEGGVRGRIEASPSPSKGGERGRRGYIEGMNSPYGASSSPSFGGARGGAFGGVKGGFLLLFLFVMFSVSAQFSGNGTESSPYIINTPAQLAEMASLVNAGTTPYADAGIYYRLDSDISLSAYQANEGWVPIGAVSLYPFMGIFNGNGKIISGLVINNTNIARPNAGLFGYLDGGIIRNVGVLNADIVSKPAIASTNTGGIVGYGWGGTVENCFFSGNIVSSATSTNYTGGIVGRINYYNDIQNCYSAGSINATTNGAEVYVGGIVGHIQVGEMYNCYSTASVTSYGGTSLAYVGGILGYTMFNYPVQNNVALNPFIGSYGANINRNFIGRVVGFINTGTPLSNNLGFDNMIKVPDETAWFNKGLNLHDGADIDLAGLLVDGTLGGRFVTPVWTTQNGKLPGFGTAADLPGFLNNGALIAAVKVIPNLVGITKGSTQTFVPNFLGFNITEELKTVTWSVNSETQGTSINTNGVLTVDVAETAVTLTVTATSTVDNSKSGTATVHFSEAFSGKGTEAEPYLITTPQELALFAQYVNQNNIFFNSAHYRLENDINLSDYGVDFNNGAGWIPIGKHKNQNYNDINLPFTGVFDGNNHKITNLYINNNEQSQIISIGLFGYLEAGGVIKNLNIVNAEILSVVATGSWADSFFIGGILGVNKGGRVENCSFSGSVIASLPGFGGMWEYDFFMSTGGIVGDNNISNNGGTTSVIKNCYSMGNVFANLASPGNDHPLLSVFAGGIAGRNNNSVISECWSTADINATASTVSDPSVYSYAGGIVGRNIGASAKISNCVALNPGITSFVSRTNSGTMVRYIGRITASNTGILANNIAFNLTMNLPNKDAWSNTGATNLDGDDITIPQIINDGSLGNRFTSPVWTTQNGKLPGFGTTVELPGFLNGNPFVMSITLDIKDAVLIPGSSLTFTPTIIGHNLTGNVIWSVNGVSASAGTTISSSGTLTVAANETAVKFTVKGTSADDTAKSATASITLFSAGDGSVTAPYIITTAEQLAVLAEKVNVGNTLFNAKYYKLGNSIDLSDYGSGYNNGAGWIPIGITNANYAFKGNFDGDNHTVTRLYINNTTLNMAGLFGYIVTGVTIKNLSIKDAEIISNRNVAANIGGIVGTAASAGVTISNCWVTGSITSNTTAGIPSTGGIVGNVSGLASNIFSISNCWFSGTIESNTSANSNSFAGGIAGQITANVSISNCYSMGSISSLSVNSTGSNGSYAGGITGQIMGANGTVQYCWSTTSITSTGNLTTYAGGITGNMYYAAAKVENCVALNPYINYRATTNIYFGRVIGRIQLDGLRSNNCGLDNMINLTESITTWNNTGDDNLDGQDITIAALIVDGTVGGRFTSTNGWSVQNGKLPGIGSPVDLPDYLTGALTVLAVKVTPNEIVVQKGESETFEAKVSGYNLVTNSVTWSVEGGIPETSITQNGLLTIANEEIAKEVVVRATSTEDITKSGTALVFVGTAFEGSGTEEDPYIIDTAEELASFAELINEGNSIYYNKHYKIINNIDLADFGDQFNNGAGWIPIGKNQGGSDIKPFKGVLDGDNHIITGLYINNTTLNNVGLFGHIDDATIKNLNIVDAEIITERPSANYCNTGVLVGHSIKSIIINCSVTESSAYQKALSGHIGGIVGMIGVFSWSSIMVDGAVIGCKFTGTISAEYSSSNENSNTAGCVIGMNYSASVLNCFAEGSIILNVNNYTVAGGVAGQNYHDMKHCYFSGTINYSDLNSGYVGGIVGRNSEGSIVSHSYSTGTISVKSFYDTVGVGGIAGDNYGRISYCWTTSLVTHQAPFHKGIAGICGSSAVVAVLDNCVALNPSITNIGGVSHMFVARILGQGSVNTTALINNYAFSHIINSTGGTDWFNKGLSSRDGADIFIQDINADGTLGGLFTEENGWTVEDGKLPGLFGAAVEMPEHLKLGDTYTLSGKVTAGEPPVGLAGVQISLKGVVDYLTVTDENGDYLIDDVYDGFSFNIKASKIGYSIYNQTIELVGNDMTVNIHLNMLPSVTVSGKVVGNDAPSVSGIEGVKVSLSGYTDYSTLTNSNGEYSIPGVFEGFIYNIKAMKNEYLTYFGTVSVVNNTVYEDITLIERLNPVVNVFAREDEDNAIIEWEIPAPPKPTNYVLDDGSSETGLRINPYSQNWMGNKFIVNEDGELESIDIFAQQATDNANRQVIIDIFNANRELIGSSKPFVLPNDDWVNVPLNNILYSGDFYVMVQWTPTDGQTNYLGYDMYGPNANAGLNYIMNNDNWALLHEVTEMPQGVFMIRVNANNYNGYINYGVTNNYESVTREEEVWSKSFSVSEFQVSIFEDLMSNTKPLNIKPETINPETTTKTLQKYTIHRLLDGQPENEWTLVSDNVTETNYTDIGWEELPSGGYLYAVRAVYSTGTSPVRFSNGLGKDWNVDFQINITTSSGDPATGATVILRHQNGNPEFVYTKISGANGILIENVWKGIYDLEITLDGYRHYHANDIEIMNSGLSHTAPLMEILYPVGIVTAQEVDTKNVLVSWTQPGAPVTFQYDNGVYMGEVGFNLSPMPPFYSYQRGVFVSCYRVNTTITSMSWFLTDAINNVQTPVNLWVFALNAQGMPTNTLIFNEQNVMSTKLEWNTFVFPEPIEAPNGFCIALSHPNNFLSLGITDPDENYPFVKNTQFYSPDFMQYSFTAITESDNFNFMLRANGIINEEVSSKLHLEKPKSETSKILTGFNIYRLRAEQPETAWTTLATNVQGLSYTDDSWGSVEWGEIQYAVKAVYSNNALSAASLSKPLKKNLYVDYQLNISTNTSFNATGAYVILTNQDDPNHVYNMTSTSTGVNLINIKRGIYNLKIALAGFEVYTAVLDITNEGQSSVKLIEIIYPVKSVTAEIVGNDAVIEWQQGNIPINRWIKYCNNDVIAARLGYSNSEAADMTATILFTPVDLAISGIVSGHSISKIALGMGTDLNRINLMEIRIWEGGNSVSNPGQLVYTQQIDNFSSFTEMAMNEVTLTTPFVIDATKELRIGWRIVNAGGYPYGSDSGPVVAGKGDLLFVNGSWYITSQIIVWNSNYSIKALVTDGNKKIIRNEELGMEKTTNRSPISYNIYRLLQGQTDNWTLLKDNVTTLNFKDTDWSELDNGTYQYAVKAVFESDLSEAMLSNPLEKKNDGINQTELAQFSIYPNPTTNELRIENGELKMERIDIYNSVGQIVMEVSNVNSTSYKLNVEMLSSGVYFISVQTKFGVIKSKFVVK